MEKLLLILSALVPIFLFLGFIYRKDLRKEPRSMLTKSFLVGCLITIPIVIFELVLEALSPAAIYPLGYLYNAFIVAALVEEGFKLFALRLYVWKNPHFDEHYDGIVYAVFVSLGFAMVENICYVLPHGFSVSISRALLSVPAHGLFAVAMGYFFAKARFSEGFELWSNAFLALALPVLLHGSFNFLIMYIAYNVETSDSIATVIILVISYLALIIGMWRLGLGYIRQHLRQDDKQLTTDTYDSTEITGIK